MDRMVQRDHMNLFFESCRGSLFTLRAWSSSTYQAAWEVRSEKAPHTSCATSLVNRFVIFFIVSISLWTRLCTGASQSSLEGTNRGTPAVTTWTGPVAVHRADPEPRSRFVQQLELEPENEPPGPSNTQEPSDGYDAIAEDARCCCLHPALIVSYGRWG